MMTREYGYGIKHGVLFLLLCCFAVGAGAQQPVKPGGSAGWDLNLPAPSDFTFRDVVRDTRPVYDTITNDPMTDAVEDTVTRSFESLVFFRTDQDTYAIAVCENRAPFYGVSTGWCDVFVFVKEGRKWRMTDFRLQAGGGGMYGNPGQFKALLRVGEQSAGIVLSGGQTHMGSLFHEDILALRNGRLKQLVSIYTYHDYGDGTGDDFRNSVCEENEYYFQPNGKRMYDLKMIRYDCLHKKTKVREVTLPFVEGYKIPADFNFEG